MIFFFKNFGVEVNRNYYSQRFPTVGVCHIVNIEMKILRCISETCPVLVRDKLIFIPQQAKRWPLY
jgi:hypothetical protein